MCAAEHLALQHFEAIDMALDRPIGPGQRHACFDRLIVVAESAGKALQGLQRTGGRARQPGLTLRWLPLADQGRKVLSKVDGLGDLGLLRASLGELVCLSRGAFLLASEDEPCRPARGQRRARRLGHRRQGVGRASVPGRQALGLPQAAGRGRDHAIAPRIAPLSKGAKQSHCGVAPGMPALQEIGFIGIEPTVPVVAAALTPCKCGGPEIALHGAQTQPGVLGNSGTCPALTVEGPDLLIEALPACRTLRRALLRWWRQRCGGWHGDSHRPIGQRHRLLAPQIIDGIEGFALRGEHLIERFPEMLQQMKAVRDLRGCRAPWRAPSA